jgi:hypothetical protein
MGKLNPETAQTIWDLQKQLLEIIDVAKTLELSLFESFGETERSIIYLDELQSIAEQATDRFSRFRHSKAGSLMPTLRFHLIS